MPSYPISIPLIQLMLLPSIRALAVFLPLYIYPGTDCSAWAPVFTAVSVHLTTKFYIVVNPSNGPGSSGSKPDENFATCIPQLRPPGSQTLILGYVDTTAPSSGNVQADIDTYAGWDSSYRPTGIFFDEISPTANLVGTYQSYISHAKSKGLTFTALDPGQAAPPAYFAMADLVNTYEDSYSAFDPSSLSGTLTKQSVILVNAPSTGSYSSVISNLGVAAVYITDVSDSSPNLPIQLSEFVSEVANAGGPGGSESSGPSGSSSGNPSPRSTSSKDSGFNSSAGLSKSAFFSTSGGSPAASSKGSSSRSALNNGIMTSTAEPSSTPTSSSVTPNQVASSSHGNLPVAGIVGGVLAVLFVLAAVLAIFITVRRRRRATAAASLNAVRPFTHIDAHGGSHSKLKNAASAIAETENTATASLDAPDMEVSSTAPPPSYYSAI